MPYSPADLAVVEACLAKGELEVEFSDRRVRYRSVQELIAARGVILSALADANSRPRQYQAVATTGFDCP